MWLRIIALFALASVVSAPAAAALGAGGSVMEPPGGHAAQIARDPSPAGPAGVEAVSRPRCADAQHDSAARLRAPASLAPSAAAARAPHANTLNTLESPWGGPASVRPHQGLPATAASVIDGSGAAAAAQRVVSAIAPGEDVSLPTRAWWGG
jgi:hypothetical protein